MRLDGEALRWSEVRQVNHLINKIWIDPDTQWLEAVEDFIQASDGPDAIEMMLGGDEWSIQDRDEPGAAVMFKAILSKNVTTWVASHELFELCAKFAPNRITWHKKK